jgi:hypothetical protein
MTTERPETQDRADPHAAPPAGTVSTASWPFALRSDFPPGAMHRTLFAEICLAKLSAGVREQLRALGCGEWLDHPDETVTVETEIVGVDERGGPRYGPRNLIPLAELAARIRSVPTPAARQAQEKERREWEERRRAEALARQRARGEAARERPARAAEGRGVGGAVSPPPVVSEVRPPVGDQINTAPFSDRCTVVATLWPKGSPCRTRHGAVRAGDVPADVRARLRAAGCGPLDDPEALIPLGAEMALGRPRTAVAVSEVVRLIQEAGRRRPAGVDGTPGGRSESDDLEDSGTKP